MATDMQIRFARGLVRGLEPERAALEAGYSPATARVAEWQILAAPSTVVVLAAELDRARLDGGLLGYQTLCIISRSDKAPAAARVTAARTLMEYAGMIGRAGQVEKDPADMSTEELKGLLGRIDTEIVSRARPVNGPAASHIPTQVTDLID